MTRMVPSSSSSSLKIAALCLGSLRGIGGYQVFLYHLLRRLQERGHPVTLVVSGEEFFRNRSFYQHLPFRVRPLLPYTCDLLSRLPWIPRAFLRWIQAREKFDLWQVVGAYPAGDLAKTLAGRVPLVLRAYGDDVQKDASLGYGLRLDPRLERRIQLAVCQMDRLIALTPTVRNCYRELGVPEEKIVEIPNGVDLERFERPFSPLEVRRAWGISPSIPLLLTVGRNHPKKGYDCIPAVAAHLCKEGCTFRWLVVGHGVEVLQPLLIKHGVSDRVRLEQEIGGEDTKDRSWEVPSDRLIELYRLADIFVFPSRLEGFPRVIGEAMAAGAAVVTTDAPGCRDVVTPEVDALVVKPDDIEGMAAAIRRLLVDPGLRQRLALAARERTKRYDFARIVEQYEEVYRELLSHKRSWNDNN